MKAWFVPPAGLPALNILSALTFAGAGMFLFFAMGWLYFDSPVAILGFGAALSAIAILTVRKADSIALRFPGGDAHPLRALWIIMAVGAALRIGWVIAVPPIQVSDFKDYTDAARQWLDTGTYSYVVRGHTLYACRPPGYPMFLMAFMAALGDRWWLATVINMLLFLASAWMGYRTALLLTGNRNTGLWAAALLALWPSTIACAGMAASEPLSLVLFIAVFWAYAEADRRAGTARGLGLAAVAGLVIGFGALVKPQMQMLPFLLGLAWLAATRGKLPKAANAAVAVVAMVLAIAPWAVRNYHQFGGRYLAISSNGGDVFYRANNPLATGDYTVVGEKSLDPYLDDELVWSKTGFAWGKEWIRSHPVDFVKLGVKKVARFLGDDASSMYWTLVRGHGNKGAAYQALVILSNAYWCLVWILALAGVAKFRKAIFASDMYGLFLWMTLFFVVAHSIFESHSRYHLPMLAFLAILAAMGLSRPAPAPTK